jgi:hypothetical protein
LLENGRARRVATDRPALAPYTGAVDGPAVVEVINAEWAQDGVPGRASIGEKFAQFGQVSPMFDARRSGAYTPILRGDSCTVCG